MSASVYNLTDLMHAEALATVGITESLMTVIYAVELGFGMGATGFIARRIGEKYNEKAGFAGAHSILLGIMAVYFFHLGRWKLRKV